MNVHYSLHTFYFIVWLYWRKINIYYLACYCLILILNIPVQRWIHHQEISTIGCWYSRFADPGMGLCCVWQRLTYFIKTIQSRLATKIFGALWNIKYTKGNPELLSSWNATSNQQILPSSQTLLKEEVMNRVLHMILFQFLSFWETSVQSFCSLNCVCVYIYIRMEQYKRWSDSWSFYMSHTDLISPLWVNNRCGHTAGGLRGQSSITGQDEENHSSVSFQLEFCQVLDGSLKHLHPHRSPNCLMETKSLALIQLLKLFIMKHQAWDQHFNSV